MSVFSKSHDVLLLLGAGASHEADIPHSRDMISNIETSILSGDHGWAKFKDLYSCVRSGIYYSEGIQGSFDGPQNYNIEKLVNTLNEIGEHNRHILYPFIGAWNPTLLEVAGDKFQLAIEFREKIVDTLRREWLAVQDYSKARNYYSGIIAFQREFQYPLRVFTLNYDLFVEKTCDHFQDFVYEDGFGGNRIWDSRFLGDDQERNPDIYLYKLHGSMNWSFDENGQLTFHDESSRIVEPAFIFGRSYKLEYRDPFFFLTSEFRRLTLNTRMIVVIGYGFGDDHINKIIQQALNANAQRVLLVVAPSTGNSEYDQKLQTAKRIGLESSDQIELCYCKASKFMTDDLSLDGLGNYLPKGEDGDVPF